MTAQDSVAELKQQKEALQKEVERLTQAEADARHQLEEMQMIFDCSPVMFWYKDRMNRMIRVNEAAAALEGLSSQALRNRSCYELYPREQAEAFYRDDMEVINSGNPKLGIIEQHRAPKTGHEVWMQTGKVPVRDKQDQVIGVVAFAVEVTEQKRAEEAALQARSELEKQNQQFNRVHTFLGSTLSQLNDAVQRGADIEELRIYLRNAQIELDRIERAGGTSTRY